MAASNLPDLRHYPGSRVWVFVFRNKNKKAHPFGRVDVSKGVKRVSTAFDMARRLAAGSSNQRDKFGGDPVKTPPSLLASLCGAASMLCAQQASIPFVNVKAAAAGEMPLPTPTSTVMVGRATCDNEGDVYTRLFDPEEPKTSFHAPIEELTPDGRLAGNFPAEDAFQGHAVAEAFFVHPTGTVYELFVHDRVYEVVQFGHDGSVKARTKLELDVQSAQVQAWQLTVFKSGEYLLAGLTLKDPNGQFPEGWAASGLHYHTPFTAIFGADGRIIKKIYEPEDEESRERSETGDPAYASQITYEGNNFVTLGDAAIGPDGNAYLLRGGPAPMIYVISPKGEVVRKLRIDAGDPNEAPHLAQGSIRFYDGRLVIGFGGRIAIIDLKGSPVASYKVAADGLEDGALSLACYNSHGLSMIGADKAKLSLLKAKLP
jgi:hypothetical protein